MASKSAYIVSISLLILSLSAHAEDNKAHQAPENETTISAEIIVVAQKTADERPFHLAMAPAIAAPQDLILENLAERLNSDEKVAVKGSLDI